MRLNRKKIVMAIGSTWVAIGLLTSALIFDKVTSGGTTEYVTFDTVKYVSSRRDMTTRLIGTDEHAKQDAISVLARVEKSTMPVIEKHAKGKIILVKQALVLDGQVPDITDAVLADLGLPTDIQSINPQLPKKVLTPYSTSDEYIQSAMSYKETSKQLKERDEIESAIKNAEAEAERQSQIEQYLP